VDLSQYAELFLAESREHLSACNQLLLEWERHPAAPEPVGGIFRAVHTVKGMAATMGYARVADLAHRMENLLDHLRRGAAGRRAGDDVLQLLFRATDALEKAIQVSAAGREQDADVAGIVAELDRAVQRFAPDTAPRHAPPSPPAPEVPTLALGPGRRVRVTLRPEAPLKGPRALIVLKRAAGLGAVSQVQPQPAALEADEFEGQFSFWLAGPAPADLVVATLAAAGDVEEVRVDDDAAPVARAETGAPLESGKARHIRVDLRRLDALMDQIGELVTARGRLNQLAAVRERASVAISIADDGRGIDRARILARAQAEGLLDAHVETLSDDQLLRVLARPGFSTAAAVTSVSGRGVGIDVAMTKIRALGGTIDIRTEVGKGTTFVLRLPVTLAIVRALIAAVGRERYALPLTYVAETVEFGVVPITTVEGREAMVLRDRVVPLVHLRQLLGVNGDQPPARRPVIVIEMGERRTGLIVDGMLGQQEIVVKGFDAPRGTLPVFSGATIMGDGVPALILDAGGLL